MLGSFWNTRFDIERLGAAYIMAKIILASASPRRRELLAQVGIVFDVVPAQSKELITETEPALVVKELSARKAEEVQGAAGPKQVVIGADTIVAFDRQILGKPKNAEDAKRMLKSLQGHTHQVYTGVTVLHGAKCISFVSCTEVTMYPMSEEQIAAYVQTGEPMDKAGAYAIQGGCAVYVKEIHGDYNNVVGLPVARLYQECMAQGIDLLHLAE